MVLPKFHAASEAPKWSFASALLAMAALSWCQNWLPVALSPVEMPYSTLTAPASVKPLIPSRGTPTARSIPVPLPKSPTATAAPKLSAGSTASRTPVEF